MIETLAASTEYHNIRYVRRWWVYLDGLNNNHSQNFPEELVYAVVSVLVVLTDLWNVNLWKFVAEY